MLLFLVAATWDSPPLWVSRKWDIMFLALIPTRQGSNVFSRVKFLFWKMDWKRFCGGIESAKGLSFLLMGNGRLVNLMLLFVRFLLFKMVKRQTFLRFFRWLNCLGSARRTMPCLSIN